MKIKNIKVLTFILVIAFNALSQAAELSFEKLENFTRPWKNDGKLYHVFYGVDDSKSVIYTVVVSVDEGPGLKIKYRLESKSESATAEIEYLKKQYAAPDSVNSFVSCENGNVTRLQLRNFKESELHDILKEAKTLHELTAKIQSK